MRINLVKAGNSKGIIMPPPPSVDGDNF